MAETALTAAIREAYTQGASGPIPHDRKWLQQRG